MDLWICGFIDIWTFYGFMDILWIFRIAIRPAPLIVIPILIRV